MNPDFTKQNNEYILSKGVTICLNLQFSVDQRPARNLPSLAGLG